MRSRDSSDVRDAFGIHDGFNSFVNDDEDDDGRESSRSRSLGRQSTLVDSGVPVSVTPTTQHGSILAEKIPKDPNEVGFDGPEDPKDPLNMPMWRKWVIVVVIATASTCV